MKKNSKQLNVGMVRQIMDRDPITKIIIQKLSGLERSRAETSVESLTQLTIDGRRLMRGEIITTFKSLEQAGAGVFLAGRRGKASRFAWACDVVQMAKEALGQPLAAKVEAKPEVTPTVGSEIVAEKPVPQKTEPMSTEPPTGTTTYFFPLRENNELHIELPKNLTSTESARLAQFVQSLGH